MKNIKDLLLEGKQCGVCSFDNATEAEFHGDKYLVSRHSIGGAKYGTSDSKAGIGLYFAKNIETNDIVIVSLSKTDKILFMWDCNPVDQGHKVDNFYCPACGKKIK